MANVRSVRGAVSRDRCNVADRLAFAGQIDRSISSAIFSPNSKTPDRIREILGLHPEIFSLERRDFLQDLRCSPMKTIYLAMLGHDNVPESGVYVQMSIVSRQFYLHLRRFLPLVPRCQWGKKNYVVYRTKKRTPDPWPVDLSPVQRRRFRRF